MFILEKIFLFFIEQMTENLINIFIVYSQKLKYFKIYVVSFGLFLFFLIFLNLCFNTCISVFVRSYTGLNVVPFILFHTSHHISSVNNREPTHRVHMLPQLYMNSFLCTYDVFNCVCMFAYICIYTVGNKVHTFLYHLNKRAWIHSVFVFSLF